MKNYEEKEKKLENVLNKLNTLSNKVIKMNEHINFLNIEKNQLLSEKEESDRNYQNLAEEHQTLKNQLEKINQDVNVKFDPYFFFKISPANAMPTAFDKP